MLCSKRFVSPEASGCRRCGALSATGTHSRARPNVSVRVLILALGRFGLVAAAQVKSLEKRWAKHRKENNLDRNGKPNPALSRGSERQGPERHSHGPT